MATECREVAGVPFCGGASCPVMGAVFKTVSECARAYLGGFDPHTPPPARFWILDFGFWIWSYSYKPISPKLFRILQNNSRNIAVAGCIVSA